MTEILSPYGKLPEVELRTVYGVDGIEGLLERLVPALEAAYGVRVEAVNTVHLAFGLTAGLRADGRPLFFKLTSSRIHSALPDLFPWLARLHDAGVPVPGIRRTRDGRWFTAPLPQSAYDVGYLMERVSGSAADRWSRSRARACAAALATIHRLGREHEPRVYGPRAFFADKWSDASRIGARLLNHAAVPRITIDRTLALIEATDVPHLVQTHIHGDARLCHLFYEGERISGIVDVDEGTWGDRLIDLAYAATSHPDPAKMAWTNVDEMADLVACYDTEANLTDGERRFLPAALSFACLEQLEGMVSFRESGRSSITEDDIARGVHVLDQLHAGFVHTA